MYLTGPPPSTFLCRFQGVLFYSAFAADSHPVEKKNRCFLLIKQFWLKRRERDQIEPRLVKEKVN